MFWVFEIVRSSLGLIASKTSIVCNELRLIEAMRDTKDNMHWRGGARLYVSCLCKELLCTCNDGRT